MKNCCSQQKQQGQQQCKEVATELGTIVARIGTALENPTTEEGNSCGQELHNELHIGTVNESAGNSSSMSNTREGEDK